MKIKQGIIVFIFSFFAFNVFSQQREYSGFFDSYYYKGKRNLNFTINGGLGLCLCDLPMEPGPSFGAGVNYKLWPRMMFGTEFHYMMFSGTDNEGTRNLQFSSTNMEFLGYARFYMIDDIIRIARDRGREGKFLKIYFMTGIGLNRYSANATYTKPAPPTDSTLIYDEPSSGMALVIPAALGFSWRISNRVSLITEAGYRYTFVDYLDGISQRVNPNSKDGYMVFDLKIQFSPFMPAKKKSKRLAPPDKYEGPKGTDTWKNRKKEEPVQRRNNYYDMEEEEQPQEEQQFDEDGNPIEPAPLEENPEEGEPLEENLEEEQEEEPLPDGWN